MIITLPEDLIQIQKTKKPYKERFSFAPLYNRMSIPRELIQLFPSKNYGLDIWVSKKEKAAFIKFVPREKAYFSYRNVNGYVGCSDLFKWFSNQEIAVFANYDYTDYQIDKKNKVVKVSLVRK